MEEVGMNLNPSKWQFVRQEVEYLGYVITPEGSKTNPKLLDDVKQLPIPQDVCGVRQFLDTASYSR